LSGNSTLLDGNNIGIAIVDSGIHAAHKAFSEDGTSGSRIVYNQSFVPGDESTDDDYGHGTHVAAIAAGAASRNAGEFRGVAYKSDIVNLKVLDANGIGNVSNLLNALQWVADNHQNYNIKVVNLSLGGAAIDSFWNDPVCVMVETLNANGILVVAASGNNGKNNQGQKIYGQVHSPGNDPSVLTVGASNTLGTANRNDDIMATYSSHGPTRSFWTDEMGTKHYDNIIKPDLVAPGNRIVSAKAKGTSRLISDFPELSNSTLDVANDDNDMMYLSGTSMSTPVVSARMLVPTTRWRPSVHTVRPARSTPDQTVRKFTITLSNPTLLLREIKSFRQNPNSTTFCQ